ncbi:MAG: hypothetical protein H7Z16_09840 [Pyrinomonadaceae bacterium]|nr:hypothetical protein [Pyrinomonadaceae bacterium]
MATVPVLGRSPAGLTVPPSTGGRDGVGEFVRLDGLDDLGGPEAGGAF